VISSFFKYMSSLLVKFLQPIADAEDRFVAMMFEEKDKDDSNKG